MIEWTTLPGLTPYDQALSLMEERLSEVITGHKNESVFLVEHNDVYTAGTSFNESELLDTENIPVIYTGRGGKFTYHGPGQRVIYPILNLNSGNRKSDIKLYVRNLEQLIINILARIGVKAYTIDNMVGIWVDHNNTSAKIAAIGVRVKKWVTYHGVAINISADIERYKAIIPCGISDFPVTSLKELGFEISIEDFDRMLKEEFKKIFE
ncbi:MAG: lipoyl(octanoyl) transferase LipB [Rickettsiaceae bacterium]|nr:lipoyl(octanoyl) transferase LipB [Rickettsiaceae bacterium]